MKPKDMVTINLLIDWRVLSMISAIFILLGVAFSIAQAQDGDPIDANQAAQQAADQFDQLTSIEPYSPQVQCGEGLIATANEECVSIDAIGSSILNSSTTGALSSVSGGKGYYYLTNANFNGNQVLTACTAGYHTASFWEILDVSNLTYDYDHPAAHVKDDSGFGPPSLWYGWVRTGQNSSYSNVAGMGNCRNWTSNSNTDYGVLVRLTNTWETPPGEIGPWDATSFTCSTVGPVWCVGN